MKETMIELYTTRMLRAMAYSLIGVFIPIYLLNLGFSFQQVVLYLLVKYVVAGVVSPVVPFIQRKTGVKHTIFLSTLFLSVFFLMLYSIQQYHWNIFLLAVLQGFDLMFFWVPLNSEFVSRSSSKHVGKQMSVLLAIPRVISISAPFIGALVISYFNFDVLLIISLLIIISSSFPLFLSREDFFKTKRIKKVFSSKINKKYSLLYFSKGMISVSLYLWPLFAYYALKEYLFVGGVSTFRSVAGLLITLLMGWLSDETSLPKLVRITSALSFFSWLVVIAVPSSPLTVALLSFLVGSSFIAFSIPTFSLVCRDKVKGEELDMMTFREVVLNVGRAVSLMLVLLVPFEKAFATAFIASAAASALLFLWAKHF